MKTYAPLILVVSLVASWSPLSIAADPPTGTAPPAPAAIPGAAIPGAEEAKRAAPPLLREGSFLARTAGSLREDPKRREWTFTPQAADRSGVRRDFVLLPNEALGEAARIARLAPADIAFELTGEVFIYRGKNYILPAMLTPLASSPTPGEAETAKPAAAPTAPSAPLPDDEEAIARELERRLAERIDAMPKAPAAPPRTTATDRDAATPATDATRTAPMRGDTPIQSRRGQLVRDNATGGWRFVFEGQLPEGGEPSMAVLPCLALERIEDNVRQSDVALPLTVTGTTTVFEGRTYLLPSIFRIARGGKGISR